jgi:hypothetical protein
MLEALRAQERIDQICAYRGGNNGCDDVFHGGFLKAVATAHVRPRNQKKQNCNQDEKQILRNGG